MQISGLIRLANEVKLVDGGLKELAEAEKAVRRTEKMRLKVASSEGFHSKLLVKMDSAVQRQMEKLDEKRAELDDFIRALMALSSDAPSAHDFEEDSRIVAQFCTELKQFLNSDRISDCPILTISVEQAIRRISNNPSNS